MVYITNRNLIFCSKSTLKFRSLSWLFSSGKLSRTSMASIQLAHTTEIPTFSWKGSTCTTTKLQVLLLVFWNIFYFVPVRVFIVVSLYIFRFLFKSLIYCQLGNFFKVENMFQELVSSIWNPAQWIQSDPVLLDRSSGPTTSSSVRTKCEKFQNQKLNFRLWTPATPN